MKTVIKILILSIVLMNISLAQDNIVLAKGSFDNLKIKGISLEKLYEMDKKFDGLKVLGKPIKVDSTYRSAEPKWVYYYSGFKLTFVQFFPTGPELLEVEVTQLEANFSSADKNLFESNQQSLRRNLDQLEFKEVSSKLTDSQKFGDEYCYLEYQYSGNKLKKLIYKIDPNL